MSPPQSQGIEYLTTLVTAQYKPDQAEPALPGAPVKGKDGVPKTTEQLRWQMAQQLAEKVKREFRPGSSSGMFVLNGAQARTLGMLKLTGGEAEQVLSLNWLKEEPRNYAINCRLQTIATMPDAPEGGKPNWKRWWLENAGANIGIRRPQDHDPLQDPVSELLNRVISAMAEAAAPEIPSHEDIAYHLLEIGVPAIRNQRPDRPTENRLDLTQIWITGTKIRNLARRMGLTRSGHAARRPESPEALLAELRERGIALRQDLGTIAGLEQLRQTLRAEQVENIYANARSRQWYDQKANQNYLLHYQYTDGGYQDNRDCQLILQGRENSGGLRTKGEWQLMRLTVPEHPDITCHSPDPANSIGFLNRIPPQAAREYLAGRSEDPNPPPPESCPRAAECPSWCGKLQESGEHPFSLTYDGRYESCRYWQFLEKYGNLEPARRENLALAAIEAELKERKRWQREKAQAQEGDQDDINEVEWGERTSPDTEPAQEKQRRQTPEKPPETRQVALF